jgi:hypothetical protein
MGVAATRMSTALSFRWSVRIVEEQQRLRARASEMRIVQPSMGLACIA